MSLSVFSAREFGANLGHIGAFLPLPGALGRRVGQMGAGLPQKLQKVVFDPFFAGSTPAFARKYAAFPQQVVIDNLVRRIEEIAQ